MTKLVLFVFFSSLLPLGAAVPAVVGAIVDENTLVPVGMTIGVLCAVAVIAYKIGRWVQRVEDKLGKGKL